MSTIQDTMTSQCVGLRLSAQGADGSDSTCELQQAVSILGSGDCSDVILESDDVSFAHAAIVKYGGSAYVCDLGARGGASLNGQLVRWARLTSGDRIGIGPFEFRVEIEGESPNTATRQPVFALRGDEEIGLVTSIDPVLLIGCDGGMDIVLNDGSARPCHAIVVWTDRGPIIRDLTGEKQSFVNGTPVTSAMLYDGNTIGVGTHEFIFEIEGETPPAFVDDDVGGRFSSGKDRSSKAVSSHSDLVAGRFERAEQKARKEREEKLQAAARESLPTSGAMVQSNRPNYFAQIMEDAEADLSELAEMEANAEAADVEDEATYAEAHEAAHAEMSDDDSPQGPEGRSAPEHGISPEVMLRKAEQLQRKTHEMRQRVAEAQRALDSRAARHREEILRERQKLRERRALLQMQAKALIEAAKSNGSQSDGSRSVALQGETTDGSVIEIHDEPAQKAFVEYVANEGSVRKLISGGLDFEEVSDFNAKETERLLNDPRVLAEDASLKSLEEKAAELVRVAQAERKEIERGEALVETLRFETERQRRALTRRQEKLRSREQSLEERFRTLAKTREAIRRERAPLLAKLKALEADEAAVRDRLSEGERLHDELNKESEALDELQESLETRERALLHKLELERQRLLTRQTELKRKAGQLAKAAREKRLRVEAEVLRQQAELEAREAEIRAKRMEIEETARGELEKTAGELEQVLGVRLSEIESELETRRLDLDAKVQELSGLNHANVKAVRSATDPIDAPIRRMAAEFATFGKYDDEAPASKTGAMDTLAAEIDAFSRRSNGAGGAPENTSMELAVDATSEESDTQSESGFSAGLGLDCSKHGSRRDAKTCSNDATEEAGDATSSMTESLEYALKADEAATADKNGKGGSPSKKKR